jgi:hypothetical protein
MQAPRGEIEKFFKLFLINFSLMSKLLKRQRIHVLLLKNCSNPNTSLHFINATSVAMNVCVICSVGEHGAAAASQHLDRAESFGRSTQPFI